MAVRTLRWNEIEILKAALAEYAVNHSTDSVRPAPYYFTDDEEEEAALLTPTQVTTEDLERIENFLDNVDSWDEEDYARNNPPRRRS